MMRLVVRLIAVAVMAVGGWLLWSNVAAINHADDPAPMPAKPFSITSVVADPDAGESSASSGAQTSTGTPDGSKGETSARDGGAGAAGTAGRPTHLRPNRLVVPSLRIDVPFYDSSVVGAELQIDPNPSTAVRWNGAPVTAGSQIFAAHVNDRHANLGPLSRINNARPGTRIYVSNARGKVSEYAATKLVGTRKAKLDQSMFRTSGERSIHLITCGGKFVKDARGVVAHADNVVLSGIPVATPPAR